MVLIRSGVPSNESFNSRAFCRAHSTYSAGAISALPPESRW
ncbi:MAG: hypothetical protein U9N87_10115 [Planctomycetota bacterium]|nr:hypothetical protein [Planctomycetota bacterium]